MSAGDEIYRRLQSAARSVSARTGVATPTQEYLSRHLIESFLERLTRTVHDRDVLKGGILLGAYGVRRPTKDADSNAISVDVTTEQLRDVIDDVAQVVVDDGVTFDATSTTVQDIREHADYPGLRVRVKASIGPWQGVTRVGRHHRRPHRAGTEIGANRARAGRSDRTARLRPGDDDR